MESRGGCLRPDVRLARLDTDGARRGRRREPNAQQRRKAAETEELRELGRAPVGTLIEGEFLVAGIALHAREGTKRDRDGA